MSKGRRVPPLAPTAREMETMRKGKQWVDKYESDENYALDKIWTLSRKQILADLPRDRTPEYQEDFLAHMVKKFMVNHLTRKKTGIRDEDALHAGMMEMYDAFEKHGAWGLHPEIVSNYLLEGVKEYVEGTINMMELNALMETDLHEWWRRTNDILSEAGFSRPGEAGYVYLVRRGNYYKIGRARDVQKRIQSLSTGHPQPIELIHTIQTNNTQRAERFFHGSFERVRVQGEWFKLTSHHIKMIRDFKEMTW